MKHAIIITCIVIGSLLGISLIIINPESETGDVKIESEKQKIDVIMPTKVSRPGCEVTDTCYVPSNIAIKSGEQVSWQNQDSAFHSVTSGKYGSPTELFDSGHMDPNEIFTLKFTNSGIYDYYCTLHPWMEGQVIVQ